MTMYNSKYPESAVDNLLKGLSKYQDQKDLIKDFEKDCNIFTSISEDINIERDFYKYEGSKERATKSSFLDFFKKITK